MRFPVFCLGFILVCINVTTSFVQIPRLSSGSVRPPLSTQELGVLPPWADLATVAAQISIVTPALVQMYNFRKKIDELDEKFDKLEQTNQTSSAVAADSTLVEGFSMDMKKALAAYQDLYGSMSKQIDAILTNEEKRSVFESDLVSSIAELQGLNGDIITLKNENIALKNNFESTSQSIRASTDNIRKEQNEQAKALDFAQKLNARERASMRRDILKEQKAAVTDMGTSVNVLKIEIEELNLLNQLAAREASALSPLDSRSSSGSSPTISITSSTKITPVVDPKLFSILQQKVESLELTANFIQQKSDQKIIDSESATLVSKNLNVSNNKKITDEIKKLNEKIDLLEKQNIDKKILKDKENMKINKSLTADDIIEEITKNEEIQSLQNEIKNLFKIYENIENLEKKSNMIEKISSDNSKKVLNLEKKIDDVVMENMKIEKSFSETPLSFDVMSGNVKDFAKRLLGLELSTAANKEIQNIDKQKIIELQTEFQKVNMLEKSFQDDNERTKKDLAILKQNQIEILEKQDLFNDKTKIGLDAVDKYLEKKFKESDGIMQNSYDELYKMREDNVLQIAALKDAIDSTNLDLSDSLERLDDRQMEESVKSRAALKVLENETRMQLQYLDSKTKEVTTKLVDFTTDSVKTLEILDKKIESNTNQSKNKIDNIEGKFDRKFSILNDGVEDLIKENVEKEIQKFSGPILNQVNIKIADLVSDVTEEANIVEKNSEKRMTSLEKQLALNNRKLENEVFSNAEFLKGSVELRMTDMQKDLRETSDDLEDKMRILDQSVESRAEQVVTEKSAIFNVKKIAKSVGRTALGGVKRVGNGAVWGVRGLGSGVVTVGRGAKNIARGGLNKLGTFFTRSNKIEDVNMAKIIDDDNNDITQIDAQVDNEVAVDGYKVEIA